NVAEAVFVNVLSDTESAALIQEHTAWASVRLSTGAEAALLRATRGDPRLIERICRSCLQTTGQGAFRQVTARTVNRAVRKFIEEQASSYEPFVEALSLIEDSPDLLRCILLLLEQGTVPRRALPIPISPDLDALALTGMVRKVEQNDYQIRNEVYRQFLSQHFRPSRVGYLMALAGRWDAAIEYLQQSLDQEDSEARSDLLAATVNAMYAAQDVKHAARYLTSGLAAVFGVKQASIWHAAPEHKCLRLVGRLGSARDETLPVSAEISMTEDSLEARAYRGVSSLRGREIQGLAERALPLLTSGSEAIGVAILWEQASGAPRAAQRERDLRLVGYLNQAARAMEEVQTRQDQLLRIAKLEQERTAQELRMARDIQVSFLPECCPSLPGWEISAQWLAAREVGGDFYDFIHLDDEHIGLVIADVSDKGMPAALFMSLCRTLVRVTATEICAPSKVLERVNRVLLTESRSNMFLSMFYGVLNWRTGLLSYANAGQNPPLLWRCPRDRTAGNRDGKRRASSQMAKTPPRQPPPLRYGDAPQQNVPEVI
ncbi:MAG: hypothetical protein FJ026_18090, partial [Chloroflexi bacterium]|nr:hypothetical protein [Chloroflexota bacterium]